MKTRSSFVSNSSSSSFVVHYKDFEYEDKETKFLLTEEEISKLKSQGFRFAWINHPSKLDVLYSMPEKYIIPEHEMSKHDYLSMVINVSCNESDIIAFLVKNNISFIASVHYGHQTVIFHKDSKEIYIYRNFGMEVETYHQNETLDSVLEGWKQWNDSKTPEIAWKVPIDDVLRDYAEENLNEDPE